MAPAVNKFMETGVGAYNQKVSLFRTRLLVKFNPSSRAEGWKVEPKYTLEGDMKIKPRNNLFTGWLGGAISEWAGPLNPGWAGL